MADLRWALGERTLPLGPLVNFMQFSGKIGQNNSFGWPPLGNPGSATNKYISYEKCRWYAPWIRITVVGIDGTSRSTESVLTQTRECVATINTCRAIDTWIGRTAVVCSCNTKTLFKGSFTLTESERETKFFLWSLSLFKVNIKLDSAWTHLEAMSLLLSR